jgi:hypothetical protein
MKQPKNDLSFVDDRGDVVCGVQRACDVFIEEVESGAYAWIATGATSISACKAGVKRLQKLLKQAEKEQARLEKGGA